VPDSTRSPAASMVFRAFIEYRPVQDSER
jgi:hypothetical protein